MIKLKNLINESIKTDYVFILEDTLWASYSAGSGTTLKIKNWNSYYTDKNDDKNYDYIVTKIVDWAQKNTPIKKNNLKKMYKIPLYKRSMFSDHMQFSEMDIFGGEIKPVQYVYMVIVHEQDYNLIHFFKNENVASYWLKN